MYMQYVLQFQNSHGIVCDTFHPPSLTSHNQTPAPTTEYDAYPPPPPPDGTGHDGQASIFVHEMRRKF